MVTTVAIYAGCSAPAPTNSPSPTAEAVTLTAKAEAEAKAILEAAEATAIVQRARATAQALTQDQGATPTATPTKGAVSPLSSPTPAGALGAVAPTSSAATAPPTGVPTASATKDSSTPVTVEKVAFVADGGLVMVSYRAPAAAAQRYWQGAVYMVDEASGARFDNVATMPVVGPLIQRPKQDGQAGYIIFYNRSVEGTVLKPGDVVAVFLNNFKQEHVAVAAD